MNYRNIFLEEGLSKTIRQKRAGRGKWFTVRSKIADEIMEEEVFSTSPLNAIKYHIMQSVIPRIKEDRTVYERTKPRLIQTLSNESKWNKVHETTEYASINIPVFYEQSTFAGQLPRHILVQIVATSVGASSKFVNSLTNPNLTPDEIDIEHKTDIF